MRRAVTITKALTSLLTVAITAALLWFTIDTCSKQHKIDVEKCDKMIVGKCYWVKNMRDNGEVLNARLYQKCGTELIFDNGGGNTGKLIHVKWVVGPYEEQREQPNPPNEPDEYYEQRGYRKEWVK